MYRRLFAIIDIRGFRQLTGGLVAASMIALGGAAGTAGLSVYEVRDVAVDVTAETAARAREQALAAGEHMAFRRLLERLTLREDHARLPELEQPEITEYVQDFSVADEKTSAVRYLARLNFRFKAQEVRGLLHDFELPFAETPSKPVLVLPVYQAAGALVLWDEPNPWREAWKQNAPKGGLVPMLFPLGDLADIASIGAGQAIEGDRQELAAIARRYRMSDVIVCFAVQRLDAAVARRKIEVYVARYGASGDREPYSLVLRQEVGETIEALLKRAAATVALHIEDEWKRQNLLRVDSIDIATVTVPISGLTNWLAIRQRLSGVAVIRRIELILLSRDEVRVNLYYIGNTEQLALALDQSNLTQIREEYEWVLNPAGTVPGKL